MPKAVITEDDRKQFPLKSCPEGFVLMRRITYGEHLTRREMMTTIGMKGDKNDMQGEINYMNRKVTEYEFARLIVDHNLEDANGKKLDFKSPVGLELLDPRIGDEIGKYINEYALLEDDDSKNSPDASLTTLNTTSQPMQTSLSSVD